MTNLISTLKQSYFQYISLLPLVHEKKLKPPLNSNYLLDLQYLFLNNLQIQNIKSHLNNLDNAINSCIISTCGAGVFNLLPFKVNDSLEIKENLIGITCQSNGFFNYSITNDKPPYFSKNHINNGLLDIYFEQNLIKIHHNNNQINLKYNFGKRFSSTQTLYDVKIDNNIARYISESNNKFVSIKQLVNIADQCNKIKIHLIIDRKTSSPLDFSLQIEQNKIATSRIKLMGQLGEYQAFNFGEVIVILDKILLHNGHSFHYQFEKIKNFSKTIREGLEIELIFPKDKNFCEKKQLTKILQLKTHPLRIININENISNIELFHTDSAQIELTGMYVEPSSLNYILELKNNSNKEVSALVKYLNLCPDYLLDSNFNKISRVFSGIKFSPHQKLLCLFKKQIQTEVLK